LVCRNAEFARVSRLRKGCSVNVDFEVIHMAAVRIPLVLCLVLVALSLLACSPSATPDTRAYQTATTAAMMATETVEAPTSIPTLTATPQATPYRYSTRTPIPSPTPMPTRTLVPTQTPMPTRVPPPTSIPTSVPSATPLPTQQPTNTPVPVPPPPPAPPAPSPTREIWCIPELSWKQAQGQIYLNEVTVSCNATEGANCFYVNLRFGFQGAPFVDRVVPFVQKGQRYTFPIIVDGHRLYSGQVTSYQCSP
jgi:hypothetical protein